MDSSVARRRRWLSGETDGCASISASKERNGFAAGTAIVLDGSAWVRLPPECTVRGAERAMVVRQIIPGSFRQPPSHSVALRKCEVRREKWRESYPVRFRCLHSHGMRQRGGIVENIVDNRNCCVGGGLRVARNCAGYCFSKSSLCVALV